jgi:hypothetical protein
MNGVPRFFRISDNGTDRKVFVSTDGVTFIEWTTVGRTDFLTADQVGFYVCADTSYAVTAVLQSWKET